MKKIKNILIYIIFILLFNLNTVYASDLTDIGKINDGFMFSENVSDDMSFKTVDKSGEDNFWNKIYDNYKIVIIGGLSIAILTFFFFFLINLIKLNTSSGNPEARKRCMGTLLWTGTACTLLGGVTFIMAFSQALFK